MLRSVPAPSIDCQPGPLEQVGDPVYISFKKRFLFIFLNEIFDEIFDEIFQYFDLTIFFNFLYELQKITLF